MSNIETSCICRSQDFRFIAVHPFLGRLHLFATIRAPDSFRSFSFVLLRSDLSPPSSPSLSLCLFPFSFIALQSRITLFATLVQARCETRITVTYL